MGDLWRVYRNTSLRSHGSSWTSAMCCCERVLRIQKILIFRDLSRKMSDILHVLVPPKLTSYIFTLRIWLPCSKPHRCLERASFKRPTDLGLWPKSLVFSEAVTRNIKPNADKYQVEVRRGSCFFFLVLFFFFFPVLIFVSFLFWIGRELLWLICRGT